MSGTQDEALRLQRLCEREPYDPRCTRKPVIIPIPPQPGKGPAANVPGMGEPLTLGDAMTEQGSTALPRLAEVAVRWPKLLISTDDNGRPRRLADAERDQLAQDYDGCFHAAPLETVEQLRAGAEFFRAHHLPLLELCARNNALQIRAREIFILTLEYGDALSVHGFQSAAAICYDEVRERASAEEDADLREWAVRGLAPFDPLPDGPAPHKGQGVEGHGKKGSKGRHS